MEKKVYVIGIGPGAYEEMTIRAVRAMEACEVIIGYTVYVDLVKEHFPGKTFLTTPMTQEVRRCEMALEEAGKGRKTAMICSGDAGVYGMAGLMHEIRQETGYEEVEIEVIPGITAATAGAALLGAPLIHDFAVISLSDLLTPWEKIEERLRDAARGDFAVCLYNPSSRKRKDYLRKACEILMEWKSPDTVCGYVRQIARDGEEKHLTTLKELKETKTDMFTTVFIGNSQTRVIGEAMVTPRGYRYEKKD
nr:precorrin-3B C(17)-methyltransferase [uncultured Sellimonas sp.]